ncbi:FHS family glucose/mannose:H+ symporter-like MFS transporter [Alicyclobacillus sacchari]|uniref:FHS family glucose/mannose:H+ symporter-like MFS transporter n=1 Tax=Alicyclobacillus sacchari TaxID=392010 RepID=A0A4R8LTV3_9BACL|nr:MFS transporter [Alicyclobacillus sacchari]TDY50187.1 FHS family glucose/mannose:H+ symporter-like MFS transporter [Alicyclobacillus sacchari]
MPLYVWLACGMYLMNGMATVALGSVLPVFIHHYQSSYMLGSDLVLAQFIGYLIGVPLSPILVKASGYRAPIAMAAAATGIAEIAFGTLPTIWLCMAMSFINGVGMSLLQATISTSLIEWFPSSRAVVMSRTEAAFGLGCVITPLLASWSIRAGDWRLCFFVVGALAVLLAVVTFALPIAQPEHHSGPIDAPTAAVDIARRSEKWALFGLFMFAILVYVGVESCVNNFFPAIFANHLHLSASAASLSVSLFWIAMVVGRMATGWVIRRLPYRPYLTLATGGTLVVMLAIAMTQWPFAAYVEAFATGMFMSGIYVVTLVFANHSFPEMTALVTRLVTFFAGIGGAILPTAFGWIMTRTSAFVAVLSLAAFAAILFAAIIAASAFTRSRSRMTQTPA